MFRLLRPAAAVAAIAAAAIAFAGCAPAAAPGASEPAVSDAAYPVTISSALGDAVIETAPQRVATYGWGATDAALALGVVPVAMTADTYSGGPDAVAPWVEQKLAELGAETPALLDASALNVEQLLATKPDVLVAPYSGLTQEEFDAVTAAGVPVVAYPTGPWVTPWRDAIQLVGDGIGKSAEAAALIEDLDAQVAAAAAANPVFATKSAAVVTEAAGTYYVYMPADPRAEIVNNLGFTTSAGVAALPSTDGFSATVSAENLDQIDADVVVLWANDEAAMEALTSSDTARLIPAVAAGAIAPLVGPEEISALSPTPLTIPYFLPTLTERLATATAAAQG